ncbi:MAG: RHS repeat-associated core domain-containing protein [Ktedonobacteraceae bacterium]
MVELGILAFIKSFQVVKYDPYGQMKAQQEGEVNPWKFAAGYLDSSTGLYKFGTRYYDPTLGRWTQQDPVGGSLGDLNSANRYVYAGDDPVNAVDPMGTDTLAICIGSAVAGILAVLLVTFVSGGLAAVFLLTLLDYEYAAYIGCLLAIVATIVTESASTGP